MRWTNSPAVASGFQVISALKMAESTNPPFYIAAIGLTNNGYLVTGASHDKNKACAVLNQFTFTETQLINKLGFTKEELQKLPATAEVTAPPTNCSFLKGLTTVKVQTVNAGYPDKIFTGVGEPTEAAQILRLWREGKVSWAETTASKEPTKKSLNVLQASCLRLF